MMGLTWKWEAIRQEIRVANFKELRGNQAVTLLFYKYQANTLGVTLLFYKYPIPDEVGTVISRSFLG